MGSASTLALEGLRGDKALDFRALDRCLSILLNLLSVNFNIMADIVILGQVKHLPDLRCTLRATLARLFFVSKTGEIVLTLLDNDQIEDRKVGGDDATADRLTTAFTVAAAVTAEARVTRGHENLHTSSGEDTLLHRETLLVLATLDLKNVALEFLQIRKNLGCELCVLEVSSIN
jgi:hypothetical protein